MKSFLVWVLTVPIFVLLRGIVIKLLWSWFVMTAFAMPPLGVLAASGLGLAAMSLQAKPYLPHNPHGMSEEEKSEREIYDYITNFFWPNYLLGVGFLVHLALGWSAP